MTMQPIWNLDDAAEWSGSEAKPTVQVTPSDPDGHLLTQIELKVYLTNTVDPDVDTPLYSTTLLGAYQSGVPVNHDLDYGLPNDTTRYLYARARDTYGEWGAWGNGAIKVRWSQAIFEHNVGAGAAQMVFSPGALAGSSPSRAFLFRTASDAAANTPTVGAWKTSIGEAEGGPYLNILVRLAIGRDTTTPTSLADMGFTYLGTAQQPDKWAYSGDDDTAWALSEAERRYGTKSLKWVRQSATMTSAEAISDVAGDPYVVPVVKNTQYTFSIWVKGNLNQGTLYGFVRAEGGDLASTASVALTGNVWQRLTTTFLTGEETRVAVGLHYDSNGTGAGDTLYVDAVQLEEGPVASSWNPGQTGAVIVDVGGITIDASRGATLRMRGSDGGANDVVQLWEKGLLIGGSHEIYGDADNLYIKKGADTAAINITGQADGDLMQRASGVWVPKALSELGIQADHLSDFNTHADARITALVSNKGCRDLDVGETYTATLASGTMANATWYDPLGGWTTVVNSGGWSVNTSAGYLYPPSAGTYLVVAEHQVGSPAGGQRIFGIGLSNATWTPLDTRHLGSSAIWNNNTSAWIVRMGSPGGSTWIRFKAYQDSGTSLGLAGVLISVVKIGAW